MEISKTYARTADVVKIGSHHSAHVKLQYISLEVTLYAIMRFHNVYIIE